MEYPTYAAFTERFGQEPQGYLEKLSLVQLLSVARALEISFVPPFEKDAPDAIVRASIIDAAVADFQEPALEHELIQAVEKCGKSGN